jgi:hypothetical protein
MFDELVVFEGSDLWRHGLKPTLRKRKEALLVELVNPSQKRREKYSDDFLRGVISAITILENLPVKEIKRLSGSKDKAFNLQILDEVEAP